MGAFLASLASHAGEVVAGVGALFVVGALIVLYRIRSRWRAFRARADVRAGFSLVGVWRAGRYGGAPARWRYELWQAVADATRALRGAETSAGGPVGDLRSLQRRLRTSADELDRLLEMAVGMPPSSPEVVELHRQVGDALTASSAIRRAALGAVSTTTGARTGALVSDAVREVESVSAGVARSRAALTHE